MAAVMEQRCITVLNFGGNRGRTPAEIRTNRMS
jgi:hypothetical protein